MKTLRISDDVHRKMTATVGTLMAQTGRDCLKTPMRRLSADVDTIYMHFEYPSKDIDSEVRGTNFCVMYHLVKVRNQEICLRDP